MKVICIKKKNGVHISKTYCSGSLCSSFKPGEECEHLFEINDITSGIENLPFKKYKCAICNKNYADRCVNIFDVPYSTPYTLNLCVTWISSINILNSVVKLCPSCGKIMDAREVTYDNKKRILSVMCLNEECNYFGINIFRRGDY